MTGALPIPYSHLGHNVPESMIPQGRELFCEVGGEPKAQAEACRDSWKKILKFFQENRT